MTEKYRPSLHMTPNSGWMNDPNGLVFFNEHYHQFYQYYPHNTLWGPMHWGHKISTDLLHWQELEPALYPDDSGMCFSGSAIVDWHNTSGLFEKKPGLLAFYTSFLQEKYKLADGNEIENPIQQQSLAYSPDGINWKKYADGKPIIASCGNPDFRDPKVLWHEQSKAWIMAVSCGQHIAFYRSTNLLDWDFCSEFGYRHGAHSKGPWECPDLFELSVEGSNEKRWILVVGIGEGAHCDGAGTQYFIGDFDGFRFTNFNHPDSILWLDFGRDYYATQSFSDIPEQDGRRIVSTWMSNHQYSLELPTKQFRSAMAMPRELFLFKSHAGLRVGQRFVKELESALSLDESPVLPINEQAINFHSPKSVMRFCAEINLKKNQTLQINVFEDSSAFFAFSQVEQGIIIRSVRQGQFGKARIDEHFPHDYCTLIPLNTKFQLDILLDKGSVELLINGGQFSFTNLVYAKNTNPYLALSVNEDNLALSNIKIFSL